MVHQGGMVTAGGTLQVDTYAAQVICNCRLVAWTVGSVTRLSRLSRTPMCDVTWSLKITCAKPGADGMKLCSP